MDVEKAKAVALFKYGIIAPACGGFLSECSKEAYYREAAKKKYMLPDGKEKTFAASTIKKWSVLYQTGGIEALMPKGRSDAGVSRTITEETGRQIMAYREKFPKITGRKIYEKLLEDGHVRYGQTSVDSVYRYLKAHGMTPEGMPPDECLSFEFDHANDCWQADTVDGPWLRADGMPARQTYLISFIDDASRLHPHGEFFFNDNAVNVQKVLKKAIMKAGVPRMLFDDNGGSYRNNQINWICAQLGIVLVHSRAYYPPGKGKEERSHKTCQQRFMECTDFTGCRSLDDLNRLYWAYLERDYQSKKHSSLGMSPRERYMLDYGRLRFMDPAALDEAFLHYATRHVDKTACISLFKTKYEVPQKYIGQKVSLRYPPEDRSIIYIYDEGTGKRLDEAGPVNKSDNRLRKRRKNVSYANDGEGGDSHV